MENKFRFDFLTGNQLKIIALISMTCDHIGKELLPQFAFLQIFGRLAFPIFAYMIAEGCRYTKKRTKYLLMMCSMAFVCQVVYYIFEKSLYQCILVTFSLAICLIYAYDYAIKSKKLLPWLIPVSVIFAIYFLCERLPEILWKTDYMIDYGFWGVVLPLFVFISDKKAVRLILTTVALILVSIDFGDIQWYSLLTVLLLALYNGKRGKAKLKYLFYIYYPLHMVGIYAVGLLFLHK